MGVQVVQTVCGGCAQSDCGIDVYVEDGKIIGIKGTAGHPYNRGNICAKAITAARIIDDPNRIRYPMKRAGARGEDRWVRISWDEALDTIAAKLLEVKEKYGPEQVAILRGTGPGWEGSLMYHQLFMFAFGSGNLGCQGHMCKFPRIVTCATTMGGEPDMDIDNTRCILLWASNPAETSLPNYWSRISKAKSRGAKLIVVDSRFSPSASKADLYVHIRPGTDGALALGLAHIIIKEGLYDKDFVENYSHGFEEYAKLAMEFSPSRVEKITGVPEQVVREVALTYGTTKPAVLFVGNGVEQLTNTMQTMRAIYCLPGLTGNFGVKGGHILPSPLPFPDLARKGRFFNELLPKSVARHPFFASKVGGGAAIMLSDIYDAVLTDEPYPLRVAMCIGSAALTIMPESDRYRDLFKKKMELIVVHDPMMTREARELADIVLPAKSYLEGWRFRFMRPGFKGSPYLQWVGLQRPVVRPVGESKSDEEFLAALGHRVGIGDAFPWNDVIGFVDDLVKPLGITAQYLVDNPLGYTIQVSESDVIGAYRTKGFNTPTKKFEFYNTSFEKAGYNPLPIYEEPLVSPVSQPTLAEEYPLILSIGIKPGLFTHTQFHSVELLTRLMPEPWVEIHPATASDLGIVEGDMVRVTTPNGEATVKAKVSEAAVNTKMVFMPYSWPEYGINNLAGNKPEDPICGAPSTHALLCKCRVQRV